MFDVLSNFLNKKKSIIGLDIGNSYIKILEVSGENLDNLELNAYAMIPVPRELIAENGEFKEEELAKISELINKCWQKAGCESKNVATCISSNNVISKTIYIPKLSNSEELQLIVESEFSKIIPEEINLNDLAIDYAYTGEQESEEFAEVLVVATKKEKLEFLQALVEGAGLNLEILDVEGFAIENLLKLMKGEMFYEGTYIFADCSASMLRMYAYVDGQLIASKDSQLGGHTLTIDLMNNLGITFEEAEKLKQERSEDEMFLEIEKNFLLNYKLEFFALLSYFNSAHSLIKIDDIILSGGVAGHPNFEKMIIDGLLEEENLMVLNEPYIAKPLENAKKSIINIQKFNKDEQNLFLATSLAVRQYLRDY